MNRLAQLLSLTAIVVAFASPAQADFIIAVRDLSLAPGGTGFIDVVIRSDSQTATPLNLFNFEFQISTGGPTRLEFVDPQPDSQLTAASYVFFGDSFDQSLSLPVGIVGNTVVPNDTFIGGDSTDSGSDVLVTTDRLLARLQVTADTVLPPVNGDTFTIQIIAGSNSFFDSTQTPGIPFESLAGTVTIAGQAVPEPGGLTLCTIGCLSLLAVSRFRRNKRDGLRRASGVEVTPCRGLQA